MYNNTGRQLEGIVFDTIKKLILNNQFIVSKPYVEIFQQREYYSRQREAYIKTDISIEKYLADPHVNGNMEIAPALLIIIECKDKTRSISVDEVEEFHAKLQQIGADNTKGIMITRTGAFQRAAFNYAKSNGIGLARIMPGDQVDYCLYDRLPSLYMNRADDKEMQTKMALTSAKFYSREGRNFYCSENENYLEGYIRSLFFTD